jgi:hypothetical protein
MLFGEGCGGRNSVSDFHELEEKVEAKFGHVEHEIEDLKKRA